MSINDSMIIKYFKLAVFADRNKIEEVKSHLNDKSINPRDVKRRLAVDLVKKYYSQKEADLAQDSFDQIFVKKDNPDNMPSCKINSDVSLIDLLFDNKLISSRGDGKRLILQNAVKINGKVCEDINFKLSPLESEYII